MDPTQNPTPAQPPVPDPNQQPYQDPQPAAPQQFQPQVIQPAQPTQEAQPFQPAPQAPQPEQFAQPQQIAQPAPQFQPPAQGYAPQPAMPQQPMQGYPAISPAHPHDKKKLIMGGGIAAAVVVVLLIAIVAYGSLMGVSKEDYRKAYDASNTVIDKYNDLVTDASGATYLSSSSETELNNSIDSFNTSLKEFKTAQESLGKQKALKNGEVKKAYAAYKDKADAFVPLMENFMSSAQAFVSVSESCKSVDTSSSYSSPTSGLLASLDTCVAAFKDSSSLKDPDVKKIYDATKNSYVVSKDALNQVKGLQGYDNYDKRSDLLDKIYAAEKDARSAVTDATSNITKKFDDSEPDDELYALAKVLSEKSIGQ